MWFSFAVAATWFFFFAAHWFGAPFLVKSRNVKDIIAFATIDTLVTIGMTVACWIFFIGVFFSLAILCA